MCDSDRLKIRDIFLVESKGGQQTRYEQAYALSRSQCLKITQNVSFEFFLILAFSTNFCPIKTDLSGNTVRPQASGFQKTRKNEPFLAFLINFCPLKM